MVGLEFSCSAGLSPAALRPTGLESAGDKPWDKPPPYNDNATRHLLQVMLRRC